MANFVGVCPVEQREINQMLMNKIKLLKLDMIENKVLLNFSL
jgi:hypothetical protein